MENYFNVPYDDRLPVGIQKVVVLGVSSNHFCNTSLHLRETGEHRLYKQKPDNQLRRQQNENSKIIGQENQLK